MIHYVSIDSFMLFNITLIIDWRYIMNTHIITGGCNMKIKKMMVLPLAVSLLSSTLISKNVFASSQDYIIDNDPVAIGFSGSFSPNMIYYSGMTGSYYDDIRMSSSSMNGTYYEWSYPSVDFGNTSGSLSLVVYLNNINFTDPYARYYVENSFGAGDYSGTYLTVGYLNQNTAPSGWSPTINCNMYSSNGENIISSRIYVSQSFSNYNCLGADAIHPYFYY